MSEKKIFIRDHGNGRVKNRALHHKISLKGLSFIDVTVGYLIPSGLGA